MKRLIKIMSLILVVTGIYGFKSDKKQKQETPVNWNGIYKGKQTKDGKEEIVVLYLNANQTYSLQSIREGDAKPAVLNGKLVLNKAGNQMTLTNAENKKKIVYKLQDNVLEKIKEKGKSDVQIYVNKLQKIDFQQVTDKYWKLIELRGEPLSSPTSTEAYILLRKETNRIEGSGGCNTFSGHFDIEQANRLKISKVAATMKACLDNSEVETQLFRAFQTVDNYTISEDGQFLSLNKGRMAPLARFEVVYLK